MYSYYHYIIIIIEYLLSWLYMKRVEKKKVYILLFGRRAIFYSVRETSYKFKRDFNDNELCPAFNALVRHRQPCIFYYIPLHLKNGLFKFSILLLLFSIW